MRKESTEGKTQTPVSLHSYVLSVEFLLRVVGVCVQTRLAPANEVCALGKAVAPKQFLHTTIYTLFLFLVSHENFKTYFTKHTWT